MKYFIILLCLIGAFNLLTSKKISIKTDSFEINTSQEVRRKNLDGSSTVLTERDMIDKVFVQSKPKIVPLKKPKKTKVSNFYLTARKKISLKGMIISSYDNQGFMKAFSPASMFIGWNKMSNPKFLNKFQCEPGRIVFCEKNLNGYDFEKDYMHLPVIPQNQQILTSFKQFKNKDVIYAEGYLATVMNSSGNNISDAQKKPAEFFYITKVIDAENYVNLR
ncbi:hypothetical protein LNTAR_24601 [Lentisphaera araneosa HTCC2155]|uniref:Uncharacterized protein n=1 Tax=Lentisphaera araneosa HTCC2155 TaxID=313628 RepID=A6DT91_9BACT|nr:hypothetical protein [Lentisphaera araneosa]EDM25164.1 hypothetical protein LNTAR_24601 [Lentisphaera araneosa HTCC2155]